MQNALLLAFIYWLCQCLDGYLGWQTITRPIVLGTITGLFCGDLKTGVILGTQLEAVYMGVSAIGGEAPSNYQAATVLGVGFVILSGAEIGTGLALAVTVGTLINAIKPVTEALKISFQPLFMKVAAEGNVKKFRAMMWAQLLCIDQLLPTIVVFVCAFGGSVALQAFINNCPAFIITGLNAAANMLVVVGLCLTTQAIWNGYTTVMYVILGFVLTKFLSLSVLPVALIGVVIAFAYFSNAMKMNKNSASAEKAEANGGDDFYG